MSGPSPRSVLSTVMPVLVLVLLGGGMPARAELHGAWPVHWMCGEADGIVVGERIGANRVKVVEWLLPPADGETPQQEIELAGLDEHSRVVETSTLVSAGKPEGRGMSLKTRRLVCFLERKGVAWYSFSAVGAGSSGLVWIENGKCFRYLQVENPGPLDLAPDTTCQSETDLRKEIAEGLADRRAWDEALRVANPEEKAIILVSYLLPRTSPEGDHKTYLRRVRQVLPQLGRTALRELMELLRDALPEDDLDEAVRLLYDLGPEARPAVPLLLPLLKEPGQVHPERVLEALGRIGDSTVAHQILPFLRHDQLPVRAEASKALAQFGYQDAAEEIALAVPAQITEDEAYHLYAMLSALKELDPARAAPLADKFIDQPAMKHMRDLMAALCRK